MAIYLVDGAHSASNTHTISNDQLNVKGSADVNLSIPIEEVWDSLSQGEKYALMIIFVAKTLISRARIFAHSRVQVNVSFSVTYFLIVSG